MSFALLPCLGCVCRIVHELALDAKVLEGSWSIGRHVAHDEIFDRAPAHDLRKTVGEREYRSANEAVEEGTCGVGRARTMVRMVLLLMPEMSPKAMTGCRMSGREDTKSMKLHTQDKPRQNRNTTRFKLCFSTMRKN